MQYRKKGKENNGDRLGRGGGGGGTLIFSYIRWLGSFLEFQKLNFLYFSIFNLGFIRKIIIFWGYDDFVDIFWGHHKN